MVKFNCFFDFRGGEIDFFLDLSFIIPFFYIKKGNFTIPIGRRTLSSSFVPHRDENIREITVPISAFSTYHVVKNQKLKGGERKGNYNTTIATDSHPKKHERKRTAVGVQKRLVGNFNCCKI